MEGAGCAEGAGGWWRLCGDARGCAEGAGGCLEMLEVVRKVLVVRRVEAVRKVLEVCSRYWR